MAHYTEAVLASLSDTVDTPEGIADAFITMVAGNACVITPSGTTLTFVALPVGTVVPVKVKRVKSTGTTASNVALLYGPKDP